MDESVVFVRQQKPRHGGKYVALCHVCGTEWQGEPRELIMQAERDAALHLAEQHADHVEPEAVSPGPLFPSLTGVVMREGLARVEANDPWHRLGIWIKTMDQGVVGVSRHGPDHPRSPNEWSIHMEFGREAEDSPMAGGAAYGMGDTLEEALNQALKDLRA